MNGNCAQVCTNTVGSYICSCESGYVLQINNRTCDGMFTMHFEDKYDELFSPYKISMSVQLSTEIATRHAQILLEVTLVHA